MTTRTACMGAKVYTFENYRLNTALSQLTFRGEEVVLEPRVFDLLVYLIENRDRVVSKDDIVTHVWGGRFTSDSAITTCLKSLRKALNDDGEQQRFVKTRRGRGFHFVADVVADVAATATVQSFVEQSIFTPEAVSLYKGKPSLIVLPFQNLSTIADDAVLSEAMAHELIQAFSRLRWIRVIARGTAFRFRMVDPDLKSIGKQLNVRYALCGSIEVLGGLRSVTVELSNCETADVVWAERFELRGEAVHELRRDIVNRVLSSLEMYIPLNEASQASLNVSENLDSWANFHLGLRHMFRFTQTDNAQATRYFEKATVLDTNFARAYAGLSFSRFQDSFLKYDKDIKKATLDARRLAERAVELDPLDPFTNYNMGRSFWLQGDAGAGQGWLERSVSLSPNFAQGYYSCSYAEIMQGKAETALQNTERALNLSPLDPLLYAVLSVRALCYLRLGNMQEAIYWSDKSARTPGAHYLIFMITALSYALNGDKLNATYWRSKALEKNPGANAQQFFTSFPFTDENFRATLSKGLRLAKF